MKIICGERVLDLDRMNAVKPDGEHAWVEIQPFTYSPGRLPGGDTGTYLLTPDQGAVSFRDMAFKILVDMGVWAGAGCVKYLIRDIARGVDRSGGDWTTASLPETGAAGELRSSLGLRSVYMPCPGGILANNLGALMDGPCDLDQAVFGMLSDYVYIGPGSTFSALHDSVSKLLESFGSDSFIQFVEGVYGVVSCDPDDVKSRLQPGDTNDGEGLDGVQAEQDEEPEPEPSGQDPVSDVPELPAAEPVKPLDVEAMSNASVRDLPKRPGLPGATGLFSSGRKLKGSDLTGTDETYSMSYYAGFYRDDMEKADSTGFADQLIRARAGHGTAPIAILEEAVTKLASAVSAQHGAGSNAFELRGMLLDMVETLRDATDKLESLPEPVPEPDTTPGTDSAPKPDTVPETGTEPAAVRDEPDTAADPEPDRGSEPGLEPAQEPVSDSVPDGPVGSESDSEPAPESEPEYDIPNYGDDGYDEPGGYGDEAGPPPEEGDDEPDGI